MHCDKGTLFLQTLVMRKRHGIPSNRMFLFLALGCTLSWACNSNDVGNAAVSAITRSCGILVFKDSVHYNLVYDFLEAKQEAFDAANSSTAVDEEKPLTDFEVLKGHDSYRKNILLQEDIAENAGVDLSANPIPQILDDDEILQTLLNNDRMMIIDNTVYYYYDDCTLFKFPAGKDCKKNINEALAYFKQYAANVQNHIKPAFTFEKIDICNDEENYRAIQSTCQTQAIAYCVPDPCNPTTVDAFMSFPGYSQNAFELISFNYTIDGGTVITPSVPAAYYIPNSNSCGWEIGSFGFRETIIFSSSNATHTIFRNAHFRYKVDNQWVYCVDTLTVNYTVPPACPINGPEIIVNGLTVTLKGANNPCNDPSITDLYSFHPLDGSPVVVYPPGTINTVQLTYSCQGEKKVKMSYSQNGCSNSKEISVFPVEAGFCCKVIPKTTCTTHYILTGGTYQVKIKLKERRNRIVAIARHFKKISGNYKRRKTEFNGQIGGLVTYKKDACDCLGIFNFIPKDKGPVNKKVIRVKLKFKTQKTAITALTGVPSFSWFKQNWARKIDNPWKFTVSTTDIPAQIFRIDCNGNCAQ
jgi:hypothetical protein